MGETAPGVKGRKGTLAWRDLDLVYYNQLTTRTGRSGTVVSVAYVLADSFARPLGFVAEATRPAT